jgi:hypothetical protein
MSRSQIAQLIATVQRWTGPSDRLPISPGKSVDLPEWTRPPLPDWLPDESRPISFEAVLVGPEDEITIETEDISGDGASVYDLRSPRQFDDQIPSFDALAYYLPFHFYRTRWGIYLSENGILEVTRHIVGSHLLAARDRWIVGLAAKALFLHEFLHHAAEVACSRLEYSLPTTLLGNSHYNPYFLNSTAAANEESIANAYIARHIRRYYSHVGARTLNRAYWGLRSFMDRQPGPYAGYPNFLRNDDYARARDSMISEMYVPWLSNSALADQPRPGDLLGSGMYFADVTPVASEYPIYLVLDRPDPHLRVAKPFPKKFGLQVFVYSNDHTPVHIHVRDLDQDMNTRYLWPSLDPYPNDERLSRRKEDYLKTYIAKNSQKLAERIDAVYGTIA